MQIDRPREEIARDMKAQAAALWGAERAEALRNEIEKAADWVSTIGRHPLEIDGEEPDFLTAPAGQTEGD